MKELPMHPKIKRFREHLEQIYQAHPGEAGSFGEILCYEIHSEPINPRMQSKTMSDGFETGLCFNELAAKWGITITFLGELIADHCARLDEGNYPQTDTGD